MKKVGIISLGCAKNLVDSENILGLLDHDKYEIVNRVEDSDVVIVNTCGFIDSAVQESLEAIGEALKENGKVIVTGCLGAKEDQIREVHPKVLEITGPHSYEQVLEHVHFLIAERQIAAVLPGDAGYQRFLHALPLPADIFICQFSNKGIIDFIFNHIFNDVCICRS